MDRKEDHVIDKQSKPNAHKNLKEARTLYRQHSSGEEQVVSQNWCQVCSSRSSMDFQSIGLFRISILGVNQITLERFRKPVVYDKKHVDPYSER